MRAIWNIGEHLDKYEEAINLAKSRGKKAGDSIEVEFLEIMEKYNIKPCGNTELTKEELLTELISKGKKILNISTDSQGKQTIEVIKPKNEENDSTP